MGVSFKISRVGSRYRPRIPPSLESPEVADGEEEIAPLPVDSAVEPPHGDAPQASLLGSDDALGCFSVFTTTDGNKSLGVEHEASFSINMYPNGFFIGKATEGMLSPLLQDIPKLLHPYDRASKSLFSAIENGYLPTEILDDIPCKYYNGTLYCEVWDFRNCMSKFGYSECDSSHHDSPTVHKVCLRMGTGNVVKDMQSISDDSWTYNDLLQVESQIIKSLQPKLYLCPKPSLERLSCAPAFKKLDFGIFKRRLTIQQHEKSDNNVKPASVDLSSKEIIESGKQQNNASSYHEVLCSQNTNLSSIPLVQQKNDQNTTVIHSLQMTSQPYNTLNTSCTVANTATAVPISLISPDKNPENSFLHARYNATLSTHRKEQSFQAAYARCDAVERPEEGSSVLVSVQEKDALHLPEEQRRVNVSRKQHRVEVSQNVCVSEQHCCPSTKETLTSKVAEVGERMNYSHHRTEEKGVVSDAPPQLKASGKSYVWKETKENLLGTGNKKANQQLLNMRSQLPHLCSRDGSSTIEHPKGGNAYLKRKLSQHLAESSDIPQVSKMGDKKIKPFVAHRTQGPVVAAIKLLKEDGIVVPAASVETTPMTAATCSSFIKGKILKDVNLESNARGTCVNERSNSSLTWLSPPLDLLVSEHNTDKAILERFSKIELITQRYGLCCKNNKADSYITTKASSSSLFSPVGFLMPENNDEIGGSRNACKTRALTYRRVRYFFAGAHLAPESWCKLVLTELDESSDHMVVVEIIYMTEEKHIHAALLPTPHYAALFAVQFTSLIHHTITTATMEHDGYELMNDQLHESTCITSDSCFRGSMQSGFSGFPLQPMTTADTGHASSTFSELATSCRTKHLNCLPQQKIMLPTRMTSSFGMTRPQNSSDFGLMQHQLSNGCTFMPLSEKTMRNVGIQNNTGLAPSMSLQQITQHLQGFSQSKMVIGGTKNEIICGEAHVSSANLRPISGTNNFPLLILNRGSTETAQSSYMGKNRQTQKVGMNTDLSFRHTSIGSKLTKTDSLLSDRVVRSNVYPVEGRGKSPLLFNKPPSDIGTNSNLQHYQLLLDIPQSSLNPQHHQHQQVGSLQHNVPTNVLMESISVSCQQFLRVGDMQDDLVIANVGSPQLSSHTVGSAGSSITAGQMDFVSVEEDNDNKNNI